MRVPNSAFRFALTVMAGLPAACLVTLPAWAAGGGEQPFNYSAVPNIMPRPSVVTPMQVLSRPDPKTVLKDFPNQAKKAHINGAARLSCRVAFEGAPDCTVEWESQPGYGFGSAAMKRASQLRLRPAMRDGRALSGLRFYPSYTFLLFDDAATPSAPPPTPQTLGRRGDYTPSPSILESVILPTGPLTVVGRSQFGFTRFASGAPSKDAPGLTDGVTVNIAAWPNGPPSYDVERVRADCSRREITRLGARSFDAAGAVSGWEISDEEAPRPVGSNELEQWDLVALCAPAPPGKRVESLEAAVKLVQAWPSH